MTARRVNCTSQALKEAQKRAQAVEPRPGLAAGSPGPPGGPGTVFGNMPAAFDAPARYKLCVGGYILVDAGYTTTMPAVKGAPARAPEPTRSAEPNSRLTPGERTELAAYVARLNAIGADRDAAVASRDRKLAWGIHADWNAAYAEFCAFKRRVRARLAGVTA